jgi:hypothetical protein
MPWAINRFLQFLISIRIILAGFSDLKSVPGERFDGPGGSLLKWKDERWRKVFGTNKSGYGERFSRV